MAHLPLQSLPPPGPKAEVPTCAVHLEFVSLASRSGRNKRPTLPRRVEALDSDGCNRPLCELVGEKLEEFASKAAANVDALSTQPDNIAAALDKTVREFVLAVAVLTSKCRHMAIHVPNRRAQGYITAILVNYAECIQQIVRLVATEHGGTLVVDSEWLALQSINGKPVRHSPYRVRFIKDPEVDENEDVRLGANIDGSSEVAFERLAADSAAAFREACAEIGMPAPLAVEFLRACPVTDLP